MAEPPATGPSAKVVSFVPVQARANAAASRPQQLALGLDQPHELLIVVTDQLHGATFLRRLLQVRPKVIVDVRFAPHFSFTAINADTVKQQIEAVGARYIRYAVPFHEYKSSLLKHDPMSIAIKLSDFVRESGSSQWPIMLLLKERVIANAFSPFLVGALSKYVGGNWMTEIVI
jgi:hypothetical protein